MAIDDTFAAHILQSCFPPVSPGDTVIVACSGGADSMALLRAMTVLREQVSFCLEAVHINHGLRREADGEERFVQAYCGQAAIRFRCFRLAPPKNPGEDWARRERYRIFESLAGEKRWVLTAHTASDQAETVILRLARGTGLHGMGGIPRQRGRILRPLLWASRRQTEEYCRRSGTEWMTDGSNLEDVYARNRVRHHVVPGLCSVNPRAEEAICRTAGQLARLDAYLNQKASELLDRAACDKGFSLEALRCTDWPVREQAVRQLLSRCRDADSTAMRLALRLIEDGTGAVQLTAEWRLTAEAGYLKLCALPAEQPPALPEKRLHLAAGTFLSGTYRFSLTREKYRTFREEKNVHEKDYIFLADCAKIPYDLVLRGRRAGDTFRHPVRGCTKTLKKWYNELHIPNEIRDRLPLLAQENRVWFLWDQGFCRDALPDEATEEVWVLCQQ